MAINFLSVGRNAGRFEGDVQLQVSRAARLRAELDQDAATREEKIAHLKALRLLRDAAPTAPVPA
ncbi:hypothetical protein OPKNFCMD_4088 [Methylobacterium crusticola]|uniref:Uncharacterized protein n=1 Tax=Methylobacterium crusticola TaxID=1697972 RepID=A0ABQ4R392_9HYPH|nr:hypothetical protein [Methylobacterium crusticola]GJD51334.1 hypothetical protein OPKNFCMD_4088 [Methylobacterium crusticola]